MVETTFLFGDETERTERRESYRRAWDRFTENRLSLVGGTMVLSVFLVAIFAPFIAPYPNAATGSVHYDQQNEPPNLMHLAGTDTNGRDIFSRILFGTRISLQLSIIVLSIAISIGTIVGSVAGYVGGWIDVVLMRITDVFLSIPSTLLALAVAASLGPSLFNAMVAIAFTWWTWYARLVRGEVLSIKEEQFIEASESLGSGRVRVIFREILPNIVAPITVKITLDMGSVILVGASLSFLGLGANPPTPDWGTMIATGRDNVLSYWWIATLPGLAISYTVLGYNLLGDGLRDMFNVEVE